jgi:glutamate--cysteine ligase
MMKQTATVQANFDYVDEAEAVAKMRTAFGVTSIVTALFAASPISEGRPNGHKSLRAAIWLETDENRAGLLPFVFAPGFSFRDYAEWALDVPMFFVARGGVYRPAHALPFRRFLLHGFEGETATMADWELHLSTLFPEVRLRRYIELRGADAGPLAMATGLAALWRGLLDDPAACAAAWALVAGASMDEREALRRAVPREGMEARLGDLVVSDLCVELVRLARSGLARLPGGADDARLLEPLEAYASAGRSPADDLLDDFTSLGGDPARLCARWELIP